MIGMVRTLLIEPALDLALNQQSLAQKLFDRAELALEKAFALFAYPLLLIC